MNGYNHKDIWAKCLKMNDGQASIEVVHWTRKFPKGWGGLGIYFDSDELEHNYNIYLYAYKGTKLYDDVVACTGVFPFHGGETYRHLTHYDSGSTILTGCDFGHAWDNLWSVAPQNGKPPVEVVANAMDIEEFIINNYGEAK